MDQKWVCTCSDTLLPFSLFNILKFWTNFPFIWIFIHDCCKEICSQCCQFGIIFCGRNLCHGNEYACCVRFTCYKVMLLFFYWYTKNISMLTIGKYLLMYCLHLHLHALIEVCFSRTKLAHGLLSGRYSQPAKEVCIESSCDQLFLTPLAD